jgi:outer membrane protein OmpA-like peptidoglycan-associated protein
MVRRLVVGLAVVALAGSGCARRVERSAAEASADAVGSVTDRQQRDLEQVLASQGRLTRDGDTLRASLASDVLFERGSVRLQAGADVELLDIARVLQRYPRTVVEIVGHTDNRGSERHNQDLSEGRAEAIRDHLVQGGVDASRLTVRGEGEQRPIGTNDTATGRAANRRIDLTIRPDDGLASEQSGAAAPPAP